MFIGIRHQKKLLKKVEKYQKWKHNVWIRHLEFSDWVSLNNSYLSHDPLMNGSCSVSKTAKRAIRHTIAVQPRRDVKDVLYVKPVSLTREVQRWRKEPHCTFHTEAHKSQSALPRVPSNLRNVRSLVDTAKGGPTSDSLSHQ